MKLRSFASCLFALLCPWLVACASTRPGPAERDAARLEEFQQFAGAPIEGFRFWRLDRWVSLGKSDLAIYTEPNKAYLIRVETPCSGLDFARGVALTSTQHRVSRRFDFVKFNDQSCPIAEIRPVDIRALRAARRGETASD